MDTLANVSGISQEINKDDFDPLLHFCDRSPNVQNFLFICFFDKFSFLTVLEIAITVLLVGQKSQNTTRSTYSTSIKKDWYF